MTRWCSIIIIIIILMSRFGCLTTGGYVDTSHNLLLDHVEVPDQYQQLLKQTTVPKDLCANFFLSLNKK